jgi:hypothetical protein
VNYKSLFVVASIILLSACFDDNSKGLNALYSDQDQEAESLLQGAEHIEFLYQQQRGSVLVSSVGRVTKVLENQTTPYPAQLLLLRLSSGRKLLIKHNIEKAKPLPVVQVGEMITFKGSYSWNPQGGMILSTHEQTETPKRSGWLKYKGDIYQ